MARNKLTDDFAYAITKTLGYDKYMKIIDVSGNKISAHALSYVIKNALLDNSSLVGFDARLNPGTTEKIERQFALCALKNIEKFKEMNISIKSNYLLPHVYSF